MKKLLIGIVIILFVLGGLQRCLRTAKRDIENYTPPEKVKIYNLNETAKLEHAELTINSVKKVRMGCVLGKEPCERSKWPRKDYFLLVEATVKNNLDQNLPVSSIVSFMFRDSTGEGQRLESFINDNFTNRLDIELTPQQTYTGVIAFDVKDSEYYILYYRSSINTPYVRFKINSSDIK